MISYRYRVERGLKTSGRSHRRRVQTGLTSDQYTSVLHRVSIVKHQQPYEAKYRRTFSHGI